MTMLPQARIVRKGGQLYAPPPQPSVSTRRPGQLKEQLHEALSLAIGVWPVFAAMLLILGMCILGNNMSAP
jgi:hypothetical protein